MYDFEREISIEKILEEQYKNELDSLIFLMIELILNCTLNSYNRIV